MPKVTGRLFAAGYTEADLSKMWSGNVLRILGEVERLAAPPLDEVEVAE